MSAWRVSKRHIDLLVAGLIWAGGFYHKGKWTPVNEENATEIGKMLWRENYRSVNYRYGERERTPVYHYSLPKKYATKVAEGGQIMNMETKEWEPNTRLVTTITNVPCLLKQAHCYDYQTCEHEQYYGSKAHSAIIYLGYAFADKFPGYEEAEWGI